MSTPGPPDGRAEIVDLTLLRSHTAVGTGTAQGISTLLLPEVRPGQELEEIVV